MRSQRISYKGEVSEENKELLRLYLNYSARKGLKKRTRENYEYELINFIKYLNNKYLLDVSERDVKEYLDEQKRMGNSVSRVRFKISTLNSFYTYCVNSRRIEKNFMDNINRPSVKREGVILEKKDLEKIRKELKKQDDLQLECYINLLMSSMINPKYIPLIKWNNVRFEENCIELNKDDEGLFVVVFFDDYTKELLKKLKYLRWKKRTKCNYIFITRYKKQHKPVTTVTLNRWVRELGKTLNIKGLTNQCIKRSAMNLYVEKGINIDKLREMIPFKSYFKITKEEKEEIDEELNKYYPYFGKRRK